MNNTEIIRRIGEARLILEMTPSQYQKHAEQIRGERLGRGATACHKADEASRMLDRIIRDLMKGAKG